MVTRKTQPVDDSVDFSQVANEVIQIPLEQEVEESFLSYAYYSIQDRAIPDARDGLKPVQRRILYTMYLDGNSPDKKHVKSAKIVGSVMGRLHPHGDSAIYDALVRMAQPFSLNIPMVDGRGNFGDRPGAGAAAARYTESRMTTEAVLTTGELKEKPVDYVPNFDQTLDQPVVLPVQFPYLLVNGVSGIAVGYATNIAPHNPGEVLDAARWLLTHPTADLDKLMEYVPGPDFPTGGVVIGKDGIREMYETGRGKFTIRAPYRVEDVGRGKKALVFYELPYSVDSERILDKLKDNVKNGNIPGVADAADLTDRRNGIRLVVETKAGFNVNVVAEALYKYTDLEVTFGANHNALVEEAPRTLGLKEMLEVFLDHRKEVVLRRSAARRQKREERLHLIEGLLRVLLDLDAAIAIIRGSADTAQARDKLMRKFKLDETQANYILDLQLRRLTKYDQHELKEEQKRLTAEAGALNRIITDEKALRDQVGKELEEVRKQIDRPRRSELKDVSLVEHVESVKTQLAAGDAEMVDTSCVVGVYSDGSVIRSSVSTASDLKSSGRGKVNPVIGAVPARTRGKVVLVTNKGRGLRVETLHLMEDKIMAGSSLGLGLAKDEKIIAVAPSPDENQDGGLGVFFATRKGTVKITSPDYPVRSDEFDLIGLENGDEIVAANWVDKNIAGGVVALLASDSSLLVFGLDKIRPQGRTGAGVVGMKLGEGSEILHGVALTAEEKENAVVISSTGLSVKNTPLRLYPLKGRATGGVRAQAFLKNETRLEKGFIGVNLVAVDSSGKKIVLPAVNMKRDGSGTKTGDQPVVFGR